LRLRAKKNTNAAEAKQTMPLSSTISKDGLQGSDRRASPRETLKSVVLLFFDKNNWGQLLDINERGMLLECAHLPQLLKRIIFTFQVMGSEPAGSRGGIIDESFTVAGEVLWTLEFERMAGVRFVDLTEESRQQIRELLSIVTSGIPPAVEEKDLQEAEASPPEAIAPPSLPRASETLSEADAPGRGLESSESASEAYPELPPPFGEETFELQGKRKPATGSVPRMTRIALISVLSCLALLALAAASAKIKASRQAGTTEPFQKNQSSSVEAGRPGGAASSGVAGSARPFQVEVVDANNRRWVLSFVQNGSKNEVNRGASRPRRDSISFAPSGLAIEKKHRPPSTKPQELHKFALAAPKIKRPSTNRVTMEGLAVPALGTDLPPSPDGAMVSILAGRAVPVPVGPPSAVGGDVQQPRPIRSVPPVYPAIAKSNHVAGDVKMDALIDSAGNVKEIKVISGPPLLQQAAEDALRQWKYEPARLDGQPVAIHLSVVMKFRIP
jgi:TonB family protein